MANRFWVLDGGDWTDTAHWSATSGGAGGETVPTTSDDVFFDENSFTVIDQVVLITNSIDCSCNNLDCSDVLYSPLFQFPNTASVLRINGNSNFTGIQIDNPYNGPYYAGMGKIWFQGGAGCTIRTGGVNLGTIDFNSGGDWTLQDDLNCLTIMVYNGYVYTGNFNITCAGNFYSAYAAGITLGSSIIRCNAFSMPESSTVDAGTSTIIVNETFQATGHDYYNIEISNTPATTFYFWCSGGAAYFNSFTANISSAITIEFGSQGGAQSSDLTFENIDINLDATSTIIGYSNITVNDTLSIDCTVASTFKFSTVKTLTADTMSLHGADGQLLSLTSTSGIYAHFDANNTSFSYLSVKYNSAGGDAMPFDGTNDCVDSGSNQNWIFTISQAIYF